MTVLFKSATVVIMLLSVVNCKENKSVITGNVYTVRFKKEGILELKKADSDALIKTLDIEIATNDYETQTGLMYRTELATTQGMLFIFPDEDFRSFYMKNTKIPLDIIYINETKVIVSIQKNAIPFDEKSLPSNAPAKYVLEINGGLSDAWGLEIGDKVAFKVLE